MSHRTVDVYTCDVCHKKIESRPVMTLSFKRGYWDEGPNCSAVETILKHVCQGCAHAACKKQYPELDPEYKKPEKPNLENPDKEATPWLRDQIKKLLPLVDDETEIRMQIIRADEDSSLPDSVRNALRITDVVAMITLCDRPKGRKKIVTSGLIDPDKMNQILDINYYLHPELIETVVFGPLVEQLVEIFERGTVKNLATEEMIALSELGWGG